MISYLGWLGDSRGVSHIFLILPTPSWLFSIFLRFRSGNLTFLSEFGESDRNLWKIYNFFKACASTKEKWIHEATMSISPIFYYKLCRWSSKDQVLKIWVFLTSGISRDMEAVLMSHLLILECNFLDIGWPEAPETALWLTPLF